MLRRSLILLLLALVASVPAGAGEVSGRPDGGVGKTKAETPSEELPLIALPQVIEHVQAPYPEAAFEQGLTAVVRLEIVVDIEGAVTEARVVVPAGHGFDEAALEAIKRFRFGRYATAGASRI